MARLSDVFRGDDAAYKNLKQRRVPITCEDGIMMTVKMDLNYLTCDDNFIPSKTEQDAFLKKFRLLSKEEVEDALHVRNSEFVTILNQMVPCVGCRRSAESLHQQVSRHNFSAFYPLTVDAKGTLSIPKDKMTHKFLCTLFHCPSLKMTALMESLSKCKSGRRCVLHSLESQRIRTVSSWVDVWDYMDKKCQEHVVLIETKTLHETLERYLRKHRFCSECRTKVCRAYSILVKEIDHATEPGYIPQLYDGIECCKEDQHLHVLCKTDFVSRLIAKAVPELVGSRRERHAKTMEIAQEEVLICLGLTVFERLHRIQQRFREEERTWEITMNVAVQALRRNFELAVEKKLGVSQLELLCAEISKEELVKQQKKEQKKQKRKRQKEKKTELVVTEEDVAGFVEDLEISELDLMIDMESKADDASDAFVPAVNSKKKKKKSSKGKSLHAPQELPETQRGRELKHSDGIPFSQSSRCSSETSRDCGYSSECNNDHATCSSPEVSEIVCSDSFCNDTSKDYLLHGTPDVLPLTSGVMNREDSHKLPLPYRSLEEQLESSCSSDEENDCIPQEELSAIQNPLWGLRREQLRLEIRSKFNELILRRSPASHNSSDAVQSRKLSYFLSDSTATGNSTQQLHPSDDEKDSGKENYNQNDLKVKVPLKDSSLCLPVNQQKLKSGPPKRSKGKMRR